MMIDKYNLQARLYPSVIVLLPVFIVGVVYITDIEEYYHYFTALISLGLLSFLLSQLGRDMGKNKEIELYKIWGGKPSVQILRHTSSYLDSITKERYRKKLTNLIEGLELPNTEEENRNQTKADELYESCSKYLISKTRDTKKFNLLFKELINYGFRRNLWGMKPIALVLVFISLSIHIVMVTNYFTVFSEIQPKDFIFFVILLAIILFWLIIVKRNWVKLTAFAYAERLYESLNELN